MTMDIQITGYIEFGQPYRIDDRGREIVGRFHAFVRGVMVTGLLLVRRPGVSKSYEVSTALFSRTSRVSFPGALAGAIAHAAVLHRSDATGGDGRSAHARKSQVLAGRGASSNAGKAG